MVGKESKTFLNPTKAFPKGSWMIPYAFKETRITKSIHSETRKLADRNLGTLFPPNSALLNNLNCLLIKIIAIPEMRKIQMCYLNMTIVNSFHSYYSENQVKTSCKFQASCIHNKSNIRILDSPMDGGHKPWQSKTLQRESISC